MLNNIKMSSERLTFISYVQLYWYINSQILGKVCRLRKKVQRTKEKSTHKKDVGKKWKE